MQKCAKFACADTLKKEAYARWKLKIKRLKETSLSLAPKGDGIQYL